MPLKKPQTLLLYSKRFNPDEADVDWFIAGNWKCVDLQAIKARVDEKEFWDALGDGQLASANTEELPGWFLLIDRADFLEQVRPSTRNYLLSNAEDLSGEDQDAGQLKWFKLGEMACTNLWIESLAGPENPFGLGDQRDTWQFCLTMLLEGSKTEREAFDATIQLLEWIRTESYFRAPEPLCLWEQQVSAGAIQRPRQHGKSRYSHWGRDLHISMAILQLERAGIPPTRNDESSEVSGADIVADIYSNTFRRPLSYEAAKAIWKRYSDLQTPLSDM